MVALRAALIALVVAGCYSPSIEECTISCGAGNACPSDTTCGNDGYCHVDMTVSCLDRPDGPLPPDGRIVDAGRDAPLPPDGRPDARLPPDAAPDAAMPPPCTDELSAIEETDAEDAIVSNLNVTKDGHVHVTYIDELTGNLRYAHRLPGATSWQFETIAHAADQLKGQTLDASGGLHVAYTDSLPTPRLMYAYRNPASAVGWVTDVIDDSAVGLDAAIAVDSNGRVHVVYWYNRTDLNYAVQLVREGDWFITPIETDGTVGEYPSIDIGPDGTLHVSYRVGGARLDLGYATLPLLAPAWNTTRLDQTGNVGAYTSLKVDDTGNVHVAYADLSNESLKYTFVPLVGQRRTTFADEDLFVGRFNSLGVGPGGAVHISYYDYGNGDLKYAVKRGTQTQFTAVTLDGLGGDDVGRHSSLDVDIFGGVHISYIDDTFGDLRYAHICPR